MAGLPLRMNDHYWAPPGGPLLPPSPQQVWVARVDEVNRFTAQDITLLVNTWLANGLPGLQMGANGRGMFIVVESVAFWVV